MVIPDQYFEATYPTQSSMERNFAHTNFSNRHRPGGELHFLALVGKLVFSGHH